MSLASRSTRGALFLSASTIVSIAIGFLGGIVLAHLLAPNDFGTFALAATLNAFVDIRTKLQFDQLFVSEQDTHPDYLDTFFSLNLGLTGISFLILCVAAAAVTLLGRPDLAVCLIVVGLIAPFDALSSAIRLSIEKQVAFKAVSLIQSLASLAQFLITCLCALAGLGLASLLIGTASGTLTGLVMFLYIAPRRPRLKLDPSLARKYLTYGVKYGFVYASSSVVLTQFDDFIIGLLSGTFILGFYDRAYRTSLWPTLLVSSALGRISLPTYSKLQGDMARLSKAFSFVLWTVLTLTTPIALTLFVTAPDLVPTIYGSKWIPSIPILQWLALFAMFRPLWDDMVSVLVATQRAAQMARLVLIQAIIMVILVVPLTWFFGAEGTAAGVGVAFSISALFLMYFGYTQLHVNLLETAGLPLLNNFAALGGYLLLRPLLPLDGLAAPLRIIVEAALLLGLCALLTLLTSRQRVFTRVQYVLHLLVEKPA